ncbi:uncharacterized protein JCM6883_005624 [Sporobolomyces salmoneus]|uniref:uncharacterized protein n=1 Tax=Sporobolomyces salmoneus TaxID=183962 RepID=UPI00317CEFB4
MVTAAERIAARNRLLAQAANSQTLAPTAAAANLLPTPSTSTSITPHVATTAQRPEPTDYDLVMQLPHIVEIQQELDGTVGGQDRDKVFRKLQYEMVLSLKEMGSPEAVKLARSICFSSVQYKWDHHYWSLSQMRLIIDVAFEDPIWKTVAIVVWTFEPAKTNEITGRLIENLNRWYTGKSTKHQISIVPPDVLFSLWDLPHIIFTNPHHTFLLPPLPPFGPAVSFSGEETSSSSSTPPLPSSFSKRTTDICIVRKIYNRIKLRPLYYYKLLKKKGVLEPLGFNHPTGIPVPVVGDFELDIERTTGELSGVNNLSIRSEEATCCVVKKPGPREQFAFVGKKAGDELFVKHGGKELLVDAVIWMSDEGRLPVEVFNNSKIDQRAWWDAAHDTGRLYRDQRPNFADRSAIMTLPFTTQDGRRCPVKIVNFGGTWQSSQYRIDLGWWNVADSANHLFATPQNPVRTTIIDALDLPFPVNVQREAARWAADPDKINKSLNDTAKQMEMSVAALKLAKIDESQVHKKLADDLELDDDDDDDEEDDDDNNRTIGHGGHAGNAASGAGSASKNEETSIEEDYQVESVKSHTPTWNSHTKRFLYALFVKKWGFKAVLDAYSSYGLTERSLQEMINGVTLTLASVMKHIEENPDATSSSSSLTSSSAIHSTPSRAPTPNSTAVPTKSELEDDSDDDFEILTPAGSSVGASGAGKGKGKAVEDVGKGKGKAVEDVGKGKGKAVEDVGKGKGKAVEDVGLPGVTLLSDGGTASANEESKGGGTSMGKKREGEGPETIVLDDSDDEDSRTYSKKLKKSRGSAGSTDTSSSASHSLSSSSSRDTANTSLSTAAIDSNNSASLMDEAVIRMISIVGSEQLERVVAFVGTPAVRAYIEGAGVDGLETIYPVLLDRFLTGGIDFA